MSKAPAKFVWDPEMGKKFGRPDIERNGYFVEMPFLTGRWVPMQPFKTRGPGRNAIGAGPKIKDATGLCYFDKEFKRLFVGEAIKGRGKKPPKPGIKYIGGVPFTPVGPAKKHATPGDYFGTFNKFDHFSNERRKTKPREKGLKNIIIGAPKMGGPGYTDICINKYPEHMSDRIIKKKKEKKLPMMGRPMVNVHYPQPFFDKNPFKLPENIKPGPTYVRPKLEKKIVGVMPFVPTGPAKWQGGCHDGCFDKFPKHEKCPYVSVFDANKPKVNKKAMILGPFYPQVTGEITDYTDSIIRHNLNFKVNQRTFLTYEPNYIKYLIDDIL